MNGWEERQASNSLLGYLGLRYFSGKFHMRESWILTNRNLEEGHEDMGSDQMEETHQYISLLG